MFLREERSFIQRKDIQLFLADLGFEVTPLDVEVFFLRYCKPDA
jgi:hypothetical protein